MTIYTLYIIDADPMVYQGYVNIWLEDDSTAQYVANQIFSREHDQ